MSSRPRRSLNVEVAALLVVLGAAAGCKVDEGKFQDRVFRCDTAAPDPLCGTDRDGQDMTCFAARQLGGADFCVEKCGDPMSLPGEDAMCVQGNAKLKTCNPKEDPAISCGRPELGCLRTDIASDEGICITMQPCTENTDCRDPVRSTCAGAYLRNMYRGGDKLNTDHLYCLQEGCQRLRSLCSPGETCLRSVVPVNANPPDICVPNCDSNLRCPPNHLCYRKLSGPDNPAVCIPGLLGFVCETDVDCMVGHCLDDGAAALVGAPDAQGLHLCTLDCDKDDDCTPYDSEQGMFVCNKDGHCSTPNAYRGASCNDDSGCSRNPGTICTWFSAADKANGDQGTCVYPCPTDGRACPALGGINHTCFVAPDQVPATPVCFPGFFGFPCFTSDNCVGDLSCRGADPDTMTPGICTTLCGGDEDCTKDRWTSSQSYCGLPDAPVCLPLLADGEDCTRPEQCQTGFCTMRETKMTCGAAGTPTR